MKINNKKVSRERNRFYASSRESDVLVSGIIAQIITKPTVATDARPINATLCPKWSLA